MNEPTKKTPYRHQERHSIFGFYSLLDGPVGNSICLFVNVAVGIFFGFKDQGYRLGITSHLILEVFFMYVSVNSQTDIKVPR